MLLLLLRCLLLACIAFALAKPSWKSPANKSSLGWVLMSRNGLAVTCQQFKPLVDSLLQAGMEFHYFEDGFAKADLYKAISSPADTVVQQPSSYRSLIASLNEQVDAKLPVYVFTDNYLKHFGGNRRAVSLNLHWYSFTPDTVAAKLAVDTMPLRITVYANTWPNDARYVKAALQAIQQFSKRSIQITATAALAAIPSRQDWLFWLSEESLPAGTEAGNVLVYAKGKRTPVASYISPATKASFDAIALYAAVVEKDTDGNAASVYWKDGFGHPLLTVEQKGNSNYYLLYTHIDPAWNELPWSNAFPQILYELLYAKDARDNFDSASDKTMIDSSQLVPLVLNEKETGIKPLLIATTNLSGSFWLLAFLLFFSERWLSFYHRKLVSNG